MPVYTYQCASCNHEFEFFQHYTDDPITVCPECETPTLRKMYEPTSVIYKGSGFYVTDQKSRTDFPKSVSQVKDKSDCVSNPCNSGM